MTTNNKLVRDYLGNLVPKVKTRKILDKYYVEDESCFLMPDGQWYRVTSTDKIAYDHSFKKYVLVSNNKLTRGVINEKGEEGLFSKTSQSVVGRSLLGSRKDILFLNTEIAEANNYIESLSDGVFYYKTELSKQDLENLNRKNIPQNERSKDYNLEANPSRKRQLQDNYEKADFKISRGSRVLAKFLGDYSFGAEFEVINGFVPSRVRDPLGVKSLKDGSLRTEATEGMEFCTVPMTGAKGVETIKLFTKELSKRCEVNNLCSLHYHFGNVRKDKLYVLSVYKVMCMLQDELLQYFPYSRTHSVRADGKVYCKNLPQLEVSFKSINEATSEDNFHENVVREFNKIYTWLNDGKSLAEEWGQKTIQREIKVIDGKKMFRDNWMLNIYTTKNVKHAVQGQKWDKASRYHNLNFLNLFFSPTGTIEFRIHEGTLNTTKSLIWLVTCACILKFAENVGKCLDLKKLTLKEVLTTRLTAKYAKHFMEYYESRRSEFMTGGEWKNHKIVEARWFKQDPEFTFSGSQDVKL